MMDKEGEYWTELGEIVTNVFAAVRCGDVLSEDVQDYLAVITKGNMSIFEGLKKVRNTVESVESVLIGIFAPYRFNYYEYIKSPAWKRKAEAAKEAAGYRCQVCYHGRDEGIQLDAHHRTYIRLGHERPEDITVLCHDCHELYEKNKKQRKPSRAMKGY
jgi:hypothetical protein